MKKFKKPNQRPTQRPPHRSPQKTSDLPSGRCVVGIHAVQELIKVRPKAVGEIWLRDNYSGHPNLKQIFDTAKNHKISVRLQPEGAMDKIISSHQGVVGFTQQEPEWNWEQLKNRPSACILALDEVEDPHNLGAVLRTAWLMGASAVLTPVHRAVALSPAVSKVAQGATEHVPLVRDGALVDQLNELKSIGFWILGLSHQAKQSLYELNIPEKVVWVLGSEAMGLRKSTEGSCDDLVSIPQADPNASYNVSVAAAIAMAETFRQLTKAATKG